MCFSLGWIEQLLIWLIVAVAIIAILKLLIPLILAQLGVDAGIVIQFINIGIWAVVLIFVVIIAFSIIQCLLGMTGAHRPL